MSLQASLEAGKFVVTAEVGPLKGTDTTEIKEVAELLRGRVDAANVTATIITTGGFVLGGAKTVNIGDIAIGDTGTAKTFLIGIGSIAVDVQVTCDQGMTGNGNTDGFLLFFFII